MSGSSHSYIFVLWSEHFEELAAATFVTELRAVGLRVRLVSLTSQRVGGTYGLALVPDLTLEEALHLADRAHAVIVPCGMQGSSHLARDPRLFEFVRRANANDARFVIGAFARSQRFGPKSLRSLMGNVLVYPPKEDLLSFARDVAASLRSAT